MVTLPFGSPTSTATECLEEVLRGHLRGTLQDMLEEELESFLAAMAGHRTAEGRRAVVRNGHHRERVVQTGLGPVSVSVPRSRDRTGELGDFHSALIPRYKRRSATFEEAVCFFYLKGLSTNDMLPTLRELFGPGVDSLSAASVSRLTRRWGDDYQVWQRRSLTDEAYVYIWVDGIHLKVRTGEHKLCTLVVMGATRDGRKELIAVEGGYRESQENWACLLRDLRSRGLAPPKLFIGDGALGFWGAAAEVYPESRNQRCWVHKTANVLDKLPQSVQPKAKTMLHEMYQSETKAEALAAHRRFEQVFGDKQPRAVACLNDSFEELFAFYDFPAAHWRHIRTTNPIESTFATVRKRTYSTRGQGSETTTLALAFKLVMEASKGWRKLNGHALLVKLYDPTIVFNDGIENAA
jgi:putative transposase